MIDIWHLKDFGSFGTLPAEVVERPGDAGTLESYAPGEAIFEPESNPAWVCLVKEGLVRIYRVAESGRELTLALVQGGEVFGEVGTLTGRRRESFAEARRRAKVWKISKDEFEKIIRSDRSVLYEVTLRIGGKLHRVASLAEDLVFRNVRSRLARLLMRLAREFGKDTKRGRSLGLPLTHEDLATLIGTTRQSVSEELNALREEGLIAGQRGSELEIVDPEALQRIVESTDAA